MIYNTLRKLPKVVQVEILETGDVTLLNPDNEEIKIEELVDVWENLQEEFNNKYNKQESNKIFNIYKEIGFLVRKYDIIKYAVEALEFDFDESLINMLLEYGYKLSKENYNEDLKRIHRESEGIITKIKHFQNMLPKPKENQGNDSGIIDNMAAYCSILGYDFDFYSISVEKYHALEPIIKKKIDAIEKQNSKNKK